MTKASASAVPVPVLDFRPTLPDLLHAAVRQHGDRDCIVSDVERLTYRDVEERSRVLAKRLVARGMGKGSRVATHFPYGTEWIVTWLAVTRIGAVHMPFSTAFKPAELRKALRHGDAALLIAPSVLFGADHRSFVAEALGAAVDAGPRPLLLPSLPYLRDVWFDLDLGRDTDTSSISDELLAEIESEVSPADLAITIFTSGTTSEPKAVQHSHGALVRKGAHLAALQRWAAGDRIMCGMPFFWVGGVGMNVVPAMYVGATMLCVDRTDPERCLDLMEREQATALTGWPGVIGPIMSHPSRGRRSIPALDNLLSLVGARHSSLGMTETIASYTYSTPAQQEIALPEGHTGSMGWLVDGAEVVIADPDTLAPLADGEEGAILVRGYFILQSMVKREREEVFTPDGFYKTGDKGYLLGDQLFLTGRLTEMIKTSGNNVAPPEVESVLRSLPGVAVAHVLGIPDAQRGEIVAALVVPAPGATPDADELREQARSQLSNFKVPRFVLVADEDELPWLATGKPDRLAIRAMLIAAAGAG